MKKLLLILLIVFMPIGSSFAIEKKCQASDDPSINVCYKAELLYEKIKPYFPYELSKRETIVSAYIKDKVISLKAELNVNSTEQLEENERHFRTMKMVKVVLQDNIKRITCSKSFAVNFIHEGGEIEFRYFFNDAIYLHSVMVNNCD